MWETEVSLEPTGSQSPLGQNNPHAVEAHCEVTPSEPHNTKSKIITTHKYPEEGFSQGPHKYRGRRW